MGQPCFSLWESSSLSFQAYWTDLRSEEYDICCQPGKVERCEDKACRASDLSYVFLCKQEGKQEG